jgi:Glycosyl transferase family 2
VTSPKISAVITAHDRAGFLASAVHSALDAGVDEVIVVRNFEGPIAQCEGRYRHILCNAPETNEKEARGLEEAQGDVVGFLDDDDLWAPEKAARLRGLFGTDPGLVYYCHAQRPVDAEGRPVRADHREFAAKQPSRFAEWDGRDFDRLVRGIWPGNNSSTVVRRTWATEWLTDFREAGWSADLFWLVAALLSGRRMQIGPEPLTMLRLHDQNMSQTRGSTAAEFRTRHRTTSERFARSSATLARIASERAGPAASVSKFLARTAEGFRFFAALEAGTRPRRAAGRAILRAAGRANPGVSPIALVSLASPEAARRLLYRSSRRRWSLG